MEKHRIRISGGNVKTGSIPSVSLPPIVTCARGVPCARPKPGNKRPRCYAASMMLRRRNIRISWRANLAFLTDDREGFFSQLCGYLAKHEPHFFRFHISGDFIDHDHIERAFDTARAFRDVRFLAFTKRHDLLPVTPHEVPFNFSLIPSQWPTARGRTWEGYRAPEVLQARGFRIAWMQNGTETRIPSNAIECPGGCDSCGFCWTLDDIGRDVWFREH